ncbi:MAG: cation diffusion facilitator family transporter [Thiogranum sp.]|jgi:cation diffusion facilitator family transporter
MSGSSNKVIFAALIGNSLVALTKFVAAAFTGSSAMLSEGIHSLVDTGNQVLLLYGIRQARHPADDQFPFGHGKEIYFWSFVVAILVFALGAGISIYEGIQHLRHPVAVENPLINYVVLGLAMIFEGSAWLFAFKEFSSTKGKWTYFQAVRRGKDPTTFVVLFEDSAAMLGLLVAFAGIGLAQWTGILYFDGLASIIIGLLLAATAVWLAYETKGLLIGESANRWIVEGVRELAAGAEFVEHVNEVLTMHVGPEYILVNISLDFRDDVPAGTVERVVAALDGEIKASYVNVRRVFVEARSRYAQAN